MEFSFEQIDSFVKKHYDFAIKKAKPLAGYIDRNFLITDESDVRYIIKFSTSDPLYYLHAQNNVLAILSAQSELYPAPLATTTGELVVAIDSYNVRLLTFLDGTFLNDIPKKSAELLINFGQTLAQLDKTLQDISTPSLSHVNLDWDIKNTLDRLPSLKYVTDTHKQRVIQYFLKQFDEQVRPKLPALRKSIIHNDANPLNVLCHENEVCGIIDFGDMVYSSLIFDPAVALTYLMMETEEPLKIAQVFLQAYHKQFALEKKELDILYYIIAARLCTSQIMSAQSKAEKPENNYASIDEERGWNLLSTWLSINPIRARETFLSACGYGETPLDNVDATLEKRHQYISKGQSVSYDAPIIMTSAAMQYMYDDRGNSYIDCVNNIKHVGHSHPHVVEAGQRQMNKLNTNTRYLYDNLTNYAERLLSKLPPRLTKIFFVNSGSAASDLAIRLARTFTSRHDFIVIDQGYHGNTQIGIDISSYKFDGKGGEGARSFIHKLAMPDTYRHPGTGEMYAQELDALLGGVEPAGFIGESILSCGGQLVLPDGYFEHVYHKIRAAGGVCIADEVQVGFGRVGEHFWGFEMQGVVPDIVIMGKPIGNGHPLAAVATTQEIADAFDNGMEFFSSFGGNPVSCEIGMAVLNVIENENLQEHAKDLGNYILQQWRELQSRFDCIGDVRGIGLFLGIEFVTSRDTKEPDEKTAHAVVNKMKERLFLLSTDGPYHNVIKFKPPMVFSYADADRLYENLGEVLVELHK